MQMYAIYIPTHKCIIFYYSFVILCLSSSSCSKQWTVCATKNHGKFLIFSAKAKFSCANTNKTATACAYLILLNNNNNNNNKMTKKKKKQIRICVQICGSNKCSTLYSNGCATRWTMKLKLRTCFSLPCAHIAEWSVCVSRTYDTHANRARGICRCITAVHTQHNVDWARGAREREMAMRAGNKSRSWIDPKRERHNMFSSSSTRRWFGFFFVRFFHFAND